MNKKLAVVTGALSDLGNELVCYFSKTKVSVIAVDYVNGNNSELYNNAENIVFFPIMPDDNNPWEKIDQVIGDRLIDYIIHASEEVAPVKTLENLSYSEWRHSFFANMEYPLFFTLHLMKQMKPQARVLFVTSELAYVPMASLGTYSISKFALEMARNILSLENCPCLFASVIPAPVDPCLYNLLKNTDNRHFSRASYYQDLDKNNYYPTLDQSADFIAWLLTETNNTLYQDQEWDITNKEHLRLWKGLHAGANLQ